MLKSQQPLIKIKNLFRLFVSDDIFFLLYKTKTYYIDVNQIIYENSIEKKLI